jgi:hypothetical protein
MAITQFDKVELLLPMTGANNGTVFTDYSLRKRPVTRTDVVTSTAQSKFSAYGSSANWPNRTTDHYLSVSGPAQFDTTNDFTFEAWIRPTAIGNDGYAAIFALGTGETNVVFFQVRSNSTGQLRLSAWIRISNVFQATPETNSGTLTADTWHHVFLQRNGNNWDIGIDGVLRGSPPAYNLTSFSPSFLYLGWLTSTYRYGGYMQDALFTQKAKYTADFTPPARMTQRTLTRTNTGADSHEYDRAVLFDWSAPGSSVVTAEVPDASGDFAAADLIDLEYGVAFVKADYDPICRGPYAVDADA